ncbi:1,2-phenylacetyl-CoA epoxidase subunit PaaE [Microbacterium kyungheense]|uniref:Ring-1,2-phenylacetyl-CoA epoxidase subunit PaaE n=1 Tax=Microbacterium kyungheense TaxID=1263636 RepID=A0A543FL43_9MICO|nr:1,2-phenylacetyl-CoA epoxidase subunit PaaE [Microbacterium kyungheense]TQM34394.1 ring-1,2-phenylacetyl-CoA epoxidase subunit PaaE [Microbacterium kyungheense]
MAPGQPGDAERERIAEALLTTAVGGPHGSRRRGRFHTLRVAAVRPLTEDAVEVTFAVPEEVRDEFDYLAGQHVALRAMLDGREVRRSYSLCRAVDAGGGGDGPRTISIAIKRDAGGRFSTWAQTELKVGDAIDVMNPQGSFTSTLADLDGAHVAGIAAGSGITPLMALAATVLARSATSRFTLVYTNRSSLDVMFLDDLSDLKDRYPTRLALHHVLSREQRTAPLLSGRLDEPRLRRILDDLVLPDTVDEWFLCGPFPLVQLCRDTLADLGVDSAHVRYELFTPADGPRDEPPAGGPVHIAEDEPVTRIDFTLDGQSQSVDSPVAARESILTAALRVRPDVPFACAGGVCGTCRARLLQGSVTMTENYALEPDELERGYVLTCQSHPTSDAVVVDYDV